MWSMLSLSISATPVVSAFVGGTRNISLLVTVFDHLHSMNSTRTRRLAIDQNTLNMHTLSARNHCKTISDAFVMGPTLLQGTADHTVSNILGTHNPCRLCAMPALLSCPACVLHEPQRAKFLVRCSGGTGPKSSHASCKFCIVNQCVWQKYLDATL